MTGDTDAVERYVDANFQPFLDDLFVLLSQPSISTTGEGIDACTSIVVDTCREYGLDDVEVIETDGQPAVIAHAAADTDEDVPTILLYGHYDVQPVTPEKWDSPPFEPTVREGPDGRDRIYARGAGDNKGQWFAHLCAIRALRETVGLPIDVTLLLEGEEEDGSPNLGQVVEDYADVLSADLAFVADGPIDSSGRPHVLMGVRGLLYVQVDVEGPNRDLHSGNYGGPVPNPAWELVRILSSMKDDEGRVAIDGFYDDVRDLTDRDRDALAEMPFDATAVADDLGVDGFADGPGDGYLERILYWPTLNIAGFGSGYTETGTKTIIPSTASVKIDMRLVADQDPDDIFEKFCRHVDGAASDSLDVSVTRHSTMDPQRTSLDSPVVEPVRAAVDEAWSTESILKPSLGGSLPTAVFADTLGVPCVTVPYANSDEDNHSPNENLVIDCFRNGIGTTVRLLSNLREDAPSTR